MKHFFKVTCAAAILTAGIITLSSFNKPKKTNTVDAYSIQLLTAASDESRGVQEWTWLVTNPNPGGGPDGTLQDGSHFSLALNAEGEAALVSAEYSFRGITRIRIQ